MIDSAPQVYTYEADGQLARGMFRATWNRSSRPLLWGWLAFVATLVGIGVGMSARGTYYDGRPADPWAFGIAFGLGCAVAELVLIAVVAAASVPWQRRKALRLFPVGSTSTVTLGPDAIVVERLGGTRTIRYDSMRLLRRFPPYWAVVTRGLNTELLPIQMLPEQAITFIRARMKGKWPEPPEGAAASPADRTFVVPPGWATHVAVVEVRLSLGTRRFWTRTGMATVVATVLAVVAAPAWFLLLPAFFALSYGLGFVNVRRTVSAALPEASVATTEVSENGFLSRNAGGVREIRYDEVTAVTVSGDVTRVVTASTRGHLIIATALVPDRLLT